MTLDEYQQAAMTTAVYDPKYAVIYPALGLAGEAGEVANKVAKVFRDRDGEFTVADKDAILKETGEVIYDAA